MFLTVVGPVGHEENVVVNAREHKLGYLLGHYGQAVEACFVNNRPMLSWMDYSPQKNDRVAVHIHTGIPAGVIPAFTVMGVSVSSATATAVANAVIMTVVTMAIGQIVNALTPQPKAAKLDASGQAFGISGFQNTTGQGIPIPVIYGEQRVTPHIIAGGIDVSSDHRDMTGRVLYCIGDSEGDGYESISGIEIDDVPVESYEGVQVHTRLGASDQTVIPEFENVSTPWWDGREIPYDDNTETGTPIVYTTKANNVNRIGVTVAFLGGLWRINAKGKHRAEFVALDVLQKKTTDVNYTRVYPQPGEYHPDDAYRYHFEEGTQGALYYKFVFDLPSADQYDLLFQVNNAGAGPNDEPHAHTITLYNVEETIFTTNNYPGFVLLALTKIPAKQIKSLQSMKVTCLVEGKRIRDPWTNALVYTRKRAWILRDMLTGPCGMDYEFDQSEIDSAQWAVESAYHDSLAASHSGGTEPYDLCDVIIGDRKWDWDWVKSVASEGRCCIVPSADKWKLLLDKPGEPNLLFAEPGNIVENSIEMEFGPPEEDPYTEILAEFRDETDHDRPALTQPIYADPDNPPPSRIQKAVHFDTIRRESQAIREIQVIIKRQFLERRRWTFTSPIGKLVSEPMDIDYLSERSIGDIGAYTGILGAGSTTTSVVLDRAVILQPAIPYLLIVQRRDNSPAETREVSTAAGNWMAVSVVSPFSQAPVEGDIYALGVMSIDHVLTRCRDVTVDASGQVKQTRTLYDPAVYTSDPLPPKAQRRKFGLVQAPSIPLWDARAVNQLVMRADGSWGSVVVFDVTPGLISHIGTITAIQDYFEQQLIYGDYTEPSSANETFTYATMKILTGVAAGQERQIQQYIGAERRFTVAAFTAPPPGIFDQYQIYWPYFGDYSGFKLESSPDTGSWSFVTKKTGVHFELDGGDQTGLMYYRITPYNTNGVENPIGRIITSVTLGADITAPPAPAAVSATATLQIVTIYCAMGSVPPDFAAVDFEVYQFVYVGGVRQIIRNVGIDRVGSAQNSGALNLYHTFDVRLVGMNYDQLLFARCRAVDYTGNVSGWVESPDFTPHQVVTADYGPNSITTINYVYSDAPTPISSTENYLQYGSVTITTVGGSVDLQAKINTFLQEGSVGASATYYIGRSGSPGNFNGLIMLDAVIDSGVGGTMMAVDNVLPGTYVYELWAQFIASQGGFAITGYKFKVQENRGGIA